MSFNLIIFASGTGTNFEAIVEACKNGVISATVILLVCNKPTANVINIANSYSIPVLITELTPYMDRYQYYTNIYNYITALEEKIDLIVLAGWMLIVTPNFINYFENQDCPIINLHPALPNQFSGTHSIERAFKEYLNGNIKYSGLMVHHVVPEVDAGEIIQIQVIPFTEYDTLEIFSNRIKYFEKPTLISAINKILLRHPSNETILNNNQQISYMQKLESQFYNQYGYSIKLSVKGKVRDCYDVMIGENYQPYYLMYHSDRLSAFNKHITNVAGKGHILMLQNIYWLNTLSHIIPNHYITHYGNCMIVKKCTPIKLEIVVRGYITGNTDTSVWTLYQNGLREYCGNVLPDGLVKNQKLPEIIVTPTTKDKDDIPISPQEIINQNILNPSEWKFIKDIAIQLFTAGQQIANEHGLILADTKYEFGKYMNNIILIDEIHTSDSSRFWKKDTYIDRFEQGLEPEKLDKDIIRDWIKSMGTPVEQLHVGGELINETYKSYSQLYEMLTHKTSPRILAIDDGLDTNMDINQCIGYLSEMHNNIVILFIDSDNYIENELSINDLISAFAKKSVSTKVFNISPIDNAKHLLDILSGLRHQYCNSDNDVVYVTICDKSSVLNDIVRINSIAHIINIDTVGGRFLGCNISPIKHIIERCGNVLHYKK
jgi:formyltetrahydrofolate-dependent phosphoribosylglycinamide formyltransferase/phosphoribosylaminoimidazole-succinocarboxamide synthase